MKLSFLVILLIDVVFGMLVETSAQFPIKLPKVSVEKPKSDEKSAPPENVTARSGGKIEQLWPVRPNSTPRFLRDTIEIKIQSDSHYWKFPKQDYYTSWVPIVSFDLFFDNSVRMRYTAEWSNPDGTPWFTEPLDVGTSGAAGTVRITKLFSERIKTNAVVATGSYGLKIVNTKINETVFQGKFAVNKIPLSPGDPRRKNENLFYVENDWNLPIGYVGFEYNSSWEYDLKPNVYTWFKGGVDGKDLEGRLFFGSQEIASTDDGGLINTVPSHDRGDGCFSNPEICKYSLWAFNWDKFLVENERSLRERKPQATFTRDKPGEYTVKIFHRGTQVRELKFNIDQKGWIARGPFADQMYLTYHKVPVPVKVTGALDKWKRPSPNDAFYGNPLSGFPTY